MEYPIKFTVFTPTYNRANTLHRPYEALRAQTCRDFEWLVVDDGSSDETRELVDEWRKEAGFPIRYLWQPNAGKGAAINLGVKAARGELFLIMDSDDGCVPNALERLLYHWNKIPADRRPGFSAVSVSCQDQHGRPVDARFPSDVFDSDLIELLFKYKFRMVEKWGFQRTDVLKEFPFPTDPRCKYIPESVVWLAIASRYKTRYVNELLRIYWIDDGAADHLTALRPDPIRGRLLYHSMLLNTFVGRFAEAPRRLVESAVNYSRYSFDLGVPLVRQARDLRALPARLLWLACVPGGYAVSRMRDRKRMRADSAAAPALERAGAAPACTDLRR